MEVIADGDLEVDFHHTVEDIGIVLGQLIRELYTRRSHIKIRFLLLTDGWSLARVVLDPSGTAPEFSSGFSKAKVGNFDVELVEVFNAVAMNSG